MDACVRACTGCCLSSAHHAWPVGPAQPLFTHSPVGPVGPSRQMLRSGQACRACSPSGVHVLLTQPAAAWMHPPPCMHQSGQWQLRLHLDVCAALAVGSRLGGGRSSSTGREGPQEAQLGVHAQGEGPASVPGVASALLRPPCRPRSKTDLMMFCRR